MRPIFLPGKEGFAHVSYRVMSSSEPDAAADGGQRTVAEQIKYARSDATRAERLAVPANDAIFQSYNSERAKLERENEWAK